MTQFLMPRDPAKFNQWEDLSVELQKSFKDLTYKGRLQFWNNHCLDPMNWFFFPLRRTRDKDNFEVVGCITPESIEERPMFYNFFKPYFIHQYVDFCDLEKKKQDLDNRLEITPDKKQLLQRELEVMTEHIKNGRERGKKYFEIGYLATLEGRDIDFNQLDDYPEYWRLLAGEVSFRYICYVKNLLDHDELKPIVENDEEDQRWTIAQRYYLLNKLGFFKLDVIKKLSIGNQEKLLSVLLKTDDRTIRGVRNNNKKYQLSEQRKNEVDQFYSNLTE